ncbi:replication initiation protein RepC [Phyllobacterium brassicacearum]|uniref:Replication initiation protein RepC n=1 Tax=Phyllobacterium brassicacearum TaxID=314235 RepID=A0A2P7BA76_9HYPH|nr:plasmid replication protein RepC [Phyllobacterium brassicacearum]PSH63374.1 replication initiation protein RepC [Phyllobacterium brassicacearum]TDQ18202.1 replication initiation protein RepC [Phyllobacterium brassicacearum]
MLGNLITTPFGRRAMSLGQLKTQAQAQEIEEGKAADKWQVYRWLCEGKEIIGVGDRSLAVLNALLSFLPENELSVENGLVVFPSNVQLSMRAHGMANATLRRHLAVLLECGLITRKDSPNGKRYSRKGRGGEITDAFGFSLAPLLARAEELQQAAESVRAASRALKLVRERITLHRRDIAKLIEVAVAEDVPGDWGTIWKRFRAIVEAIPRQAVLAALEPILSDLAALHDEVAILLENHVNAENPSVNESQNEPQQQNSNTDSTSDLEPGLRSSQGPKPELVKAKAEDATKAYPLGLVMKACPEIADYAASGINNWRDLMATAAQVRGYLGISPSAYEDALDVFGQENTAIVIACILQRAQNINSAGGYLRALTEKTRAGEFSVGPMLMAALKANGVQPQLVTAT